MFETGTLKMCCPSCRGDDFTQNGITRIFVPDEGAKVKNYISDIRENPFSAYNHIEVSKTTTVAIPYDCNKCGQGVLVLISEDEGRVTINAEEMRKKSNQCT